MSGDFIDTNVFVHLFDETSPDKQQAALALIQDALALGTACISFQVVQETLNVITRKLKVPVTLEDATQFLEKVLLPLWRVNPSRGLYRRALDLQGRYGFGFYDSLILSAALEAGCSRLFSEDLKDGQRIEGLTIANPFSAIGSHQ
jgi:predicted nucleic acid-binding protein